MTGQILTLDEALQETIPPLLSLLDALPEDSAFLHLEPPQRRQRTLDGLTRLLVRESRVQPLLVVFEDVHWIDAATQACLDSVVESLPRCVLDGMIRQARSLFFLGRRQELVDLLLGQQERVVQLQNPLLAGQYYMQLGNAYTYLGKREQAVQNLQHALAEGTQGGDAMLMGRAHGLLSLEMMYSGAYRQGLSHAQQAVSLLEGPAERSELARALLSLSLLYVSIGDFPHSLAVATRVQTFSETIGNRRLQAGALTTMGLCYTAHDES